MNPPWPDVIPTRRLELRILRPENVSQEYVDWLNDPEVNRFLEARRLLHTRDSVEQYVRDHLREPAKSRHFGVFDSGGTRHVGTATLPSIDGHHLYAAVSFVIGKKEVWGKGYATEAVHGVVVHAFRDLGLVKFWAGYYAGHEASAKVLARVGFREEGRIREKLLDARGVRVDHVLVGLLAREFVPHPEWLPASRASGGTASPRSGC